MKTPRCVSVYPPVLVKRLMRSPCCVCIPLFFGFYGVRIVSKERRRLVLPRSSCIFENKASKIKNHFILSPLSTVHVLYIVPFLYSTKCGDGTVKN
jgi:hypothetical protein